MAFVRMGIRALLKTVKQQIILIFILAPGKGGMAAICKGQLENLLHPSVSVRFVPVELN